MLEEVKHCKEIMKKHFRKQLVISEEDEKFLEKLLNVIYVINYILNKKAGIVK